MENSFGEWIRGRRLEAKKKSFEAATDAGMKKQAWSDYENNRGRNKDEKPPVPRLETLSAIASGLGLATQIVVDAATYYYSEDAATIVDMTAPDVHALFEALNVDDQQELVDMARLKWRRTHPNTPLPTRTLDQQQLPSLPQICVLFNPDANTWFEMNGEEITDEYRLRSLITRATQRPIARKMDERVEGIGKVETLR